MADIRQVPPLLSSPYIRYRLFWKLLAIANARFALVYHFPISRATRPEGVARRKRQLESLGTGFQSSTAGSSKPDRGKRHPLWKATHRLGESERHGHSRIFCLQRGRKGATCDWNSQASVTNWAVHFKRCHAEDNPDLCREIVRFEQRGEKIV